MPTEPTGICLSKSRNPASTRMNIHPSIQPASHPPFMHPPCIHPYIHTYTRAHVHTSIHPYIDTYTHNHTHTHTYIHTYFFFHRLKGILRCVEAGNRCDRRLQGACPVVVGHPVKLELLGSGLRNHLMPHTSNNNTLHKNDPAHPALPPHMR